MNAEFDAIEEEIEQLHERIAGYRRAIALSRGAIVVAAVALGIVVLLAPAYRTPAFVLGAIAAMIGGTVWYGASTASRTQAEARLAAADARRSALLDAVVARNGWQQASGALH